MTLTGPIAQLAQMHGIAVEYWDQAGNHHDISTETVVAVLASLGVDAGTDTAVTEAIEARAVDRARNAIKGLLEMAPEQALVRQADGSWTVDLAVPTDAVLATNPVGAHCLVPDTPKIEVFYIPAIVTVTAPTPAAPQPPATKPHAPKPVKVTPRFTG